MIKQVIIDKGGGMYERVIWDDVTKKRIGEETIGFLKGDAGVVPIVGNEFIGENASLFRDKTFPSVCKYCKPNLPKSGISLESQCRLLSAIQVQFTDPYCVYGSSLFNLSCTLQLPGLRFIIKFYDENNVEYDSLLIESNQLNFSVYLHTAVPHTITVQVQDSEPGVEGKYRIGECIRKFKYLAFLGSSVECVIDISRNSLLDITYDPINHLILYKGVLGLSNFPNQINLITTDGTYGPHYMTPITKGVVTDFTTQPALGWFHNPNRYKPAYLLKNINFGNQGSKYNDTVAILGAFLDDNTGRLSNFWTMKIGTLSKGGTGK